VWLTIRVVQDYLELMLVILLGFPLSDTHTILLVRLPSQLLVVLLKNDGFLLLNI
jgi:hypothetical protein